MVYFLAYACMAIRSWMSVCVCVCFILVSLYEYRLLVTVFFFPFFNLFCNVMMAYKCWCITMSIRMCLHVLFVWLICTKPHVRLLLFLIMPSSQSLSFTFVYACVCVCKCGMAWTLNSWLQQIQPNLMYEYLYNYA